MFGGEDGGKGGEQVERGEVEDEAEEDGDGEGRQCTTHHAQEDGSQAEALQGETLELAAAP